MVQRTPPHHRYLSSLPDQKHSSFSTPELNSTQPMNFTCYSLDELPQACTCTSQGDVLFDQSHATEEIPSCPYLRKSSRQNFPSFLLTHFINIERIINRQNGSRIILSTGTVILAFASNFEKALLGFPRSRIYTRGGDGGSHLRSLTSHAFLALFDKALSLLMMSDLLLPQITTGRSTLSHNQIGVVLSSVLSPSPSYHDLPALQPILNGRRAYFINQWKTKSSLTSVGRQ